jgi:uncharacterized Zn finger protein (UPF0148 family)
MKPRDKTNGASNKEQQEITELLRDGERHCVNCGVPLEEKERGICSECRYMEMVAMKFS